MGELHMEIIHFRFERSAHFELSFVTSIPYRWIEHLTRLVVGRVRLVHEFKVEAEMGRMRVSYREAAGAPVKLRHLHQTNIAGRNVPTGSITSSRSLSTHSLLTSQLNRIV
jgi:translation elongation factor EF-G